LILGKKNYWEDIKNEEDNFMLDKIEVSEQDELVFEFDSFELTIYNNEGYILSEEGYFPVEGLQSFKKMDENTYIISNEDGDRIIISEEDFEKIKEIYLKHI
jgi:hypothetical protein